jgi:hypothetical protein
VLFAPLSAGWCKEMRRVQVVYGVWWCAARLTLRRVQVVYGVWWCAARLTMSIEGGGGASCMLVQVELAVQVGWMDDGWWCMEELCVEVVCGG